MTKREEQAQIFMASKNHESGRVKCGNLDCFQGRLWSHPQTPICPDCLGTGFAPEPLAERVEDGDAAFEEMKGDALKAGFDFNASSPPPESGKTLDMSEEAVSWRLEVYTQGYRLNQGCGIENYERHDDGLAAVAAESVKLEQSAHLETKKRLIQSDDDCVVLHDEIASLKRAIKRPTCDHCGAFTIDECPRCGAPQCCPQCCKIDSQVEEIASLKQELQESAETKSVAIKEVARLSRELGAQDGVVGGLKREVEEKDEKIGLLEQTLDNLGKISTANWRQLDTKDATITELRGALETCRHTSYPDPDHKGEFIHNYDFDHELVGIALRSAEVQRECS